MSRSQLSCQFVVGRSQWAWLWPAVVLVSLYGALLAGPFSLWLKVACVLMAPLLAYGYWRRYQQAAALAQLRYQHGRLLVVFNNQQEPELITLVGQQRVLPWLVELYFEREQGQRQRWGIWADAMPPEQFRQLKVFVLAYGSRLIGV